MRRYYDRLGIHPVPTSDVNTNSENAGITSPSSDFPQPHFVTNALNSHQIPSTSPRPREAGDLGITDLGLADLAFAMELDNEGQDEGGEKYYVPAKFGPKKGDSSQGR
jgi:hypothetical protein